MSRIFDALQRAQGEQAGTAALPEGSELLKEAERRVASDWKAVVAVKESGSQTSVLEAELSSGFVSTTGTKSDATGPNVSLLTSVERAEALNCFKSLPISVPQESHLASLLDRKSATAESMRLLAVRLRDIRRSRTLKKLVITSTIPREGKSTIASNLACSLSRRVDEKVLLIEGDLRLPTVFHMFGIERRVGICELLRGDCQLTDCVYHLPEAGIWVLPSGIATGNPLELIQSSKMTSVMEQLSSCFDWIVIDSPPILPLADTSIWMRLADGVLLVTRQGVTEKKQLKKGLEALEPSKVIGALLNGSKASKYSEYYYGESGE